MNKAFVLSFVIAIALSATIIMAQGLSSEQISLQGRLTDSDGVPLDGTYVATFEIFDEMTGGTSLWSETQTVTVDKGLFQTQLGKVEALDLAFDAPYYVEVSINDKELSPRYVLAASPYTLGTATIAANTIDKEELVWGYDSGDGSFASGQSESAYIIPAKFKTGKHGNMLCQMTYSADAAKYDCVCLRAGYASGQRPQFKCYFIDRTTNTVANAPALKSFNWIAIQYYS